MTTTSERPPCPERVAPEAWDAYCEWFDHDPDPDRFHQRFEGHFDSVESFGREYADRFGDIPDFLASYVNWRAFGLSIESIELIERPGSVYAFNLDA